MTMSHHPHRILPPGETRKRKDREAFDRGEPATPKAAELSPSNRLLAGYMAHEFLTKGTLFGQKFELDSAPAEAVPLACGSISAEPHSQATELSRPSLNREQQSYGEVSTILKTEGTHIPGIVNPTQLSGWIHR